MIGLWKYERLGTTRLGEDGEQRSGECGPVSVGVRRIGALRCSN